MLSYVSQPPADSRQPTADNRQTSTARHATPCLATPLPARHPPAATPRHDVVLPPARHDVCCIAAGSNTASCWRLEARNGRCNYVVKFGSRETQQVRQRGDRSGSNEGRVSCRAVLCCLAVPCGVGCLCCAG